MPAFFNFFGEAAPDCDSQQHKAAHERGGVLYDEGPEDHEGTEDGQRDVDAFDAVAANEEIAKTVHFFHLST